MVRHALSDAVGVMVAVALVVTARASFAAETAGDAASVLKALANPQFEVREQATQQLLADASMTPARVAELYASAQAPEQRHRLLRVARHHHLRVVADRYGEANAQLEVFGALGVPQDALGADQLPRLNRSAVRVSRTFPGFPSYAALKRDDLILAVNGQALHRTNDASVTWGNFLQMIKSQKPGDTVALTLWRDGETVEVPLVLASSASLSMYVAERHDGGGTTRLAGQWVDHWRRTQAELFEGSLEGDGPPLVVDWP